MTDLRTAAQQALEAMSSFESGTNGLYEGEFAEEISALKAALVEDAMQKFADVNQELMAALGCEHCNQPLYAAVKCRVCGRVTEPVQEPVAWSYELATTMLEHGYDGWEHLITRYKPNVPEGSIRNLTPLFTAPPQRKPLTDDQLDDIAVAARRGNLYDLRIAIERAHGVGGDE